MLRIEPHYYEADATGSRSQRYPDLLDPAQPGWSPRVYTDGDAANWRLPILFGSCADCTRACELLRRKYKNFNAINRAADTWRDVHRELVEQCCQW